MKKTLLLLVMLFTMLTNVVAQSNLVATLSHEGTVKTFTSSSAFKDAYEEAVDGDVITLSSGVFQGVDTFKKYLTVRGAGMTLEDNPTIIRGTVYLSHEIEQNLPVVFEGLRLSISCINRVPLNTLQVIKCNVLSFSESLELKNAKFVNCVLGRESYQNTSSYSIVPGKDPQIINSLLINVYLNARNATITNCTIINDEYQGLQKSTVSNSILKLIQKEELRDCLLTNCYICNLDGDYEEFIRKYEVNSIGSSFTGVEDPFVEGSATYELKDEYKNSWLGTDGTQVGMHGGAMPFNATPTNPQISKFNVASKTTADGKLSVDIEVKGN